MTTVKPPPCSFSQVLHPSFSVYDPLTILQTTIQDLVQISPADFGKPSKQALKDAINTKYSNKIIQNVGLCICLFDLLQTSEGLIGHGTGLVNINGRFSILELNFFCSYCLVVSVSLNRLFVVLVGFSFRHSWSYSVFFRLQYHNRSRSIRFNFVQRLTQPSQPSSAWSSSALSAARSSTHASNPPTKTA
jgi:hypothetical protein